ncbi:hypothetical protein ACPPVW_05830 [Leifsonia sp. McL0607]
MPGEPGFAAARLFALIAILVVGAAVSRTARWATTAPPGRGS